MKMTFRRGFRLVERGEPGLACDEMGVALGGVDLARVRRGPGGDVRCEARPPNEIGRILRAAYGPTGDAAVLRIHRRLRRAALRIEAADLGRARVEAAMLSLPNVSPAAMAKLDELAQLEKGANTAWQNEPRLPAGQPGGGQWTTGGAAPEAGPSQSPSASVGPESNVAGSSSSREGAGGAGSDGGPDHAYEMEASLVYPVPASPVAKPFGDRDTFQLPKALADIGPVGLIAVAASLLDRWHADAAQQQITKAMTRFDLDPSLPSDVMAASAYVWAQYALPLMTDAPFSGPRLDAAAQAVMRIVLVKPGALPALIQDQGLRSEQAYNLITAAAANGLANYDAMTRARPPGVAPELQTRSSRARAAIGLGLQDGEWQAHHIIPAEAWGYRKDIALLARRDGWNQDGPGNLIALPKSEKARAETADVLPIHNGSHGQYNAQVKANIDAMHSPDGGPMTPVRAHALLDELEIETRAEIIAGRFNPFMKLGQTWRRISRALHIRQPGSPTSSS